METKDQKIFFPNLTGLRFIGAFMVFLCHAFSLGREMWGEFFHSSEFSFLAKLMERGMHGVSLFFVLSGFLICFLLLQEAKTKTRINVGSFFMRRTLRIWPLYFLIVLFGFFIFPLLPGGIETKHHLLNYTFFLSNLDEIWFGWNDSINFLTITWSVSIEEQFYIAWFLLLLLIPAFRRGKGFLIYFLVLIVLSLSFRMYFSGEERIIYYHTLSVMSDMAIGGICAVLCFNNYLINKIKTLSKIWIYIIYGIGILTVLFSKQLLPGSLLVVERLCIGFFFAFVILEQVYAENSFFKADKVKGFYKLGNISYGLYMYHCIVIFYVQLLFQKMEWNTGVIGFLLFLVSSLLLTVGISYLSYRFIELPFLR
jgi:peptidoglycan/LPS O-acetylase OafA/YrhL